MKKEKKFNGKAINRFKQSEIDELIDLISKRNIIQQGCDAVLKISDTDTKKAIKKLYYPKGGDPKIVSGESGAAGLAGLLKVINNKELYELKSYLNLNKDSKILLFNTEGDTDENSFKKIISDNSFDLVFASHVLEYVKNDRQAIQEIKRVLRPGGLAFLPVPMLHEKTIDYDKRQPNKRIIRETGVDYFDRYREVFTEVKVHDPSSFNEKYNLTIDMEDESSSKKRMYQLPNFLPVCKA